MKTIAAKKPLVKCPYCGEKFRREDTPHTAIKSRYYHNECVKSMREDNVITQATGKFIPMEGQNDYQRLIAYICHLYGIKAPTGQIQKQIDTYTEDYNYKYEGMRLALEFFHEIEGNPVKDDSGVGIIPYIYDRAKNFHIKKLNIRNNYEEKEPEVRVFKVRPREPRTNKQIDLNDL